MLVIHDNQDFGLVYTAVIGLYSLYEHIQIIPMYSKADLTDKLAY